MMYDLYFKTRNRNENQEFPFLIFIIILLLLIQIIHMYFYFIDYDLYNSGIIYIKIKEILRNGPNVLSLVDIDYSLKFGLKYLPKSIKEFKCVV